MVFMLNSAYFKTFEDAVLKTARQRQGFHWNYGALNRHSPYDKKENN